MEIIVDDEIKPEYVEWFKGLISRLKINGVWYSPSLGTTFRKTAENEFTLESIIAPLSMKPIVEDFIEKTKVLAKEANIVLKTDAKQIQYY